MNRMWHFVKMYEFSPYIKDNEAFLTKLASTKSDRKKNKLIQTASADQILAILEIIHNILKSNLILNRRQKRKLARYAEYYRSIARSRSERSARKRIQEGSGIALGAILIPALSILAQHLIEKIVN